MKYPSCNGRMVTDATKIPFFKAATGLNKDARTPILAVWKCHDLHTAQTAGFKQKDYGDKYYQCRILARTLRGRADRRLDVSPLLFALDLPI